MKADEVKGNLMMMVMDWKKMNFFSWFSMIVWWGNSHFSRHIHNILEKEKFCDPVL